VAEIIGGDMSLVGSGSVLAVEADLTADRSGDLHLYSSFRRYVDAGGRCDQVSIREPRQASLGGAIGASHVVSREASDKYHPRVQDLKHS
jgi:hypothetical protein